MGTQSGDLRQKLGSRGAHRAVQMSGAVALHVQGHVVHALSSAYKQSLLRQFAAEGSQHGIVPIQDGQASRLQVVENLTLGLEDGLPAA